MAFDEWEHNYNLAIQDYDGFTFSGATRYVAYDGTTRGRKILLGNYVMQWELEVDDETKTNVQLNSTNTYSKHHSHLRMVGLRRRILEVDCAIETEGQGLDFAPAGYQRLSIPILLDLLYFNHRFYVTDYLGSQSTTETPIYQLMNETTSLYYSMYTSQAIGFKGMPVMVSGVTNLVVRKGIITFRMRLTEDTGEA